MTRLGEAHDNTLLEEGQQAEERIKSVDYDVWKCGACGHHFTLRVPKWVSRYEKCPQCRNHAKSSTEKVIAAATTTSSGKALVVETCAFCLSPGTHEGSAAHPAVSSSSGGSSSGGSSSLAAADRVVAEPAGATRSGLMGQRVQHDVRCQRVACG